MKNKFKNRFLKKSKKISYWRRFRSGFKMKPLTTRKELKKREFLINAKALMQDRMILAKEIFIWRFTPPMAMISYRRRCL